MSLNNLKFSIRENILMKKNHKNKMNASAIPLEEQQNQFSNTLSQHSTISSSISKNE